MNNNICDFTIYELQAATKSKIEELGGTFKDKISSELTCCISTSGKLSLAWCLRFW